MDQGTAAVLGACVGMVGTLGAAVSAYVAARHQVREQGKTEHKKTIRAERREAYRGFLMEVSRFERNVDLARLGLIRLQLDGAAPEVWVEKFSETDDLSDQIKELKVQSTDLLLAGPIELAIQAGPVIDALNDEFECLHSAICGYSWGREEEEEYKQVREVASQAITKLGALASQILNMDLV
ncbi:hypothetical protein ITI46_06705 [Streptomyces oryzae]|uniref:Uncharacterized protein n=1 Tax=Streptomyces oryzae TaxID=1434886 RepID=A0ABS3X7N7_9ACTN|nr:hypothetical protein [Streptomyces oryzae]MBO8191383.1 hypothetical protein [Streptomyces oryzae]